MDAVDQTKRWLEKIVIDLSLCPFAAQVFFNNNIIFSAIEFKDVETSITIIENAIQDILDPDTKFTTCLIIFNSELESFEKYLDVYYTIEDIILHSNNNTKIQFASFHPKYQFEGTQQSDIENFTNRSPFPIIHLLRTDLVEEAIESHPDIDAVPVQNIKKMKEMGLDRLKSLFEGV